MPIDFRKDLKTIVKYLSNRVRDYPVYVNLGPGRDEDPISMITLGYQFDQAGWIAVVFDTRRKPEVDGEWQNYLDENTLDFHTWFEGFDNFAERDKPLIITRHDGLRLEFNAGAEMEELAAVFGDALQACLTECRDQRVLTPLPLTKDCLLSIEEFNGYYGWTDYLDGRKKTKLQTSRKESATPKQRTGVEIWSEVLENNTARGFDQDEDDPRAVFQDDAEAAVEIVMEDSPKLGSIALLEFACRWADKPEWTSDSPRTAQATASSLAVSAVLDAISQAGHASARTEVLLQEFVRVSVRANTGRKLWGGNAYHAANCLHKRFPNYPKPQMDKKNNRLLNPKPFSSGE